MTALTPAQVREHARALIELRVRGIGIGDVQFTLVADLDAAALTNQEWVAARHAIADAIRTARITVDWDEETI